jgi:hypothetical protein
MPASKLRKIYNDFTSTVQEVFDWIKVINDLAGTEDSQLKNEHVYFAYELAFIKIFTGWEEFLQESFISYMTGSSVSGYKPKVYIKKVGQDHALKYFQGLKIIPTGRKLKRSIRWLNYFL